MRFQTGIDIVVADRETAANLYTLLHGYVLWSTENENNKPYCDIKEMLKVLTMRRLKIHCLRCSCPNNNAPNQLLYIQ